MKELNLWEMTGLLIICMASVMVLLKILIHLAESDGEYCPYFLQMTPRVILLCMVSAEAVYICCHGHFGRWLVWRMLLLCVVAACLLMACITDVQNCMVYAFVWWFGGAAGLLLLSLTVAESIVQKVLMIQSWQEMDIGCLEGTHLAAVMLFICLQKLLFSKMYGTADCHAFYVCALAECALGLGMKEYLIHMLLAFVILAVVQGLRHNISRSGNLKCARPFLPYITVSFWILLLTTTC